MTVKVLKSPAGQELVQISRCEYEDIIDARDHALAIRDVTAGSMPIISEADMDAYLDAPTPLAFWRKRKGMTQNQLADAIEMSQPYVAQIEGGQKVAAVVVYSRLARVLGVRIDDLVVT